MAMRDVKEALVNHIYHNEPCRVPNVLDQIRPGDRRFVSRKMRELERDGLIRFIPSAGWVLDKGNLERFGEAVIEWQAKELARAYQRRAAKWGWI